MVIVLVACVIGLIIWARGTDHHRGQDVGALRAPHAVSQASRAEDAPMSSQPPASAARSAARRLTGFRERPTMLDALLPIVVLIALLALTIALFGIDATNGPLQVALLLSAAFASLIAFKNGYTVAGVADAAVGGVTSAVGAIFILLAVGALIGTWNMAGTIPTIVDYRDRGGQPDLVLPDRRRGLCPGGHGDRQLLDHRRHPGRRLRRHGERDGPRPTPSPPAPSSAAPTSATR